VAGALIPVTDTNRLTTMRRLVVVYGGVQVTMVNTPVALGFSTERSFAATVSVRTTRYSMREVGVRISMGSFTTRRSR
jgi:hypothetical protein